MNRISSYFKKPVTKIGWFTGIDSIMPRWLSFAIVIVVISLYVMLLSDLMK